MEKEITIYDIAKQLNLSPATVSRALQDHPAINSNTNLMINSRAKEMGYRHVWAVFQPFTFSRTAMLLDDFAKALSIADTAVLTSSLRSAGQDGLCLLRGVVEGFGGRLVAVHRLAELLVEDGLHPWELRVADRARHAAVHQRRARPGWPLPAHPCACGRCR